MPVIIQAVVGLSLDQVLILGHKNILKRVKRFFMKMGFMDNYSLDFPDDFDDVGWDAKGCFQGTLLTVDGIQYCVSFYDAVRLQQEVESALNDSRIFFEKNLVIVNRVDKENIVSAIYSLEKSNQLQSLVPERRS